MNESPVVVMSKCIKLLSAMGLGEKDMPKTKELENEMYKTIFGLPMTFAGIDSPVTTNDLIYERQGEILLKLDEINYKLDRVFGHHALIGGKWVDPINLSQYRNDGSKKKRK